MCEKSRTYEANGKMRDSILANMFKEREKKIGTTAFSLYDFFREKNSLFELSKRKPHLVASTADFQHSQSNHRNSTLSIPT